MDYFSRPFDVMTVGEPPLQSSNQLALKAIASMNPNVPNVDAAVDLAELHELPGLLKSAGGIALGLVSEIAKGSAKANLLAQFGIGPILSDYLKLLDFADEVAQRERQLLNMATSEGMHFRRTLGSESWEARGIVLDQGAFHSAADNQTSTNKIRMTVHGKRRYWFTARAKLSYSLPEREVHTLAARVALGENQASLASVWQLLPWSWLIDWFSNTGDIANAFRGGIAWTWTGINVMSTSEYYVTGSFPSPRSGFTYSPMNPNAYAVVKRRTPVSIIWTLPTFTVPFLSARQMSILVSLFATKI